ncbi:tumor necrosis factor-inducible gene 6 protein-like [Lethenteron reissneri]|uniref:tumor necrosis factor-inducible gene 6 protein-like n=1 Tax=Lethenteron reissneri TaxID=7753 RepID=UPI002AB702F2|nr:tumor necrosis factor-inducible gene 6 protein-like [Lethenteron reissneri]
MRTVRTLAWLDVRMAMWLACALLGWIGEAHGWAFRDDVWHNSVLLEEAADVFHIHSRHGRYLLTLREARAICAYEGGALATIAQLRKAQRAGLHNCVAGWLADARVAYPVTKASQQCGFGKVGVVDYGVRLNRSERWDAYCYRKKVGTCGGRHMETALNLSSPDYPGYAALRSCVWTVRVPVSKRVRLSFLDFDLERDGGCLADFLEVYDSYEDVSGLVDRFCGDALPPVIVSTTNVMTLKFHSDASVGGRGFLAYYEAVDPPTTLSSLQDSRVDPPVPPTNATTVNPSAFPHL